MTTTSSALHAQTASKRSRTVATVAWSSTSSVVSPPNVSVKRARSVLRIAPRTAQPVHPRRSATIDSNEQATKRHFVSCNSVRSGQGEDLLHTARFRSSVITFSQDVAAEPEKRDPGDHASDRCHGSDHQRSQHESEQ